MSSSSKLSKEEFAKFKRSFSLNRCFYPGCQEKAIGAHSIQEKGPLKYIADQVSTQMSQVYFLDNDLNYSPENGTIELLQTSKRRLKVRGIGEASMFTGFCINHDALFSGTIENVLFEGKLEQCFFHSYRTFAYDIHQKAASFKGTHMSMENPQNIINDGQEKIAIAKSTMNENIKEFETPIFNIFNDSIEQLNKVVNSFSEELKVGLNERYANRKNIVDNLILSNSLSEMQFCVKSVDGLFPISAATVIHYLDDTSPMIRSSDGIVYDAAYAITIFPEPSTSKTHFIIGAVNENPNVSAQIKRFENLKQGAFLRLMSNFLLLRGTNTYLSPRLYNVLTEQEKEELINIRVEHEALDTEFGIGYCDFHLFDNRFKE